MKYLFVVALVALAIQVASSASATTTTEATTTTTTTAASTTTTTASSTHKKRCWRGNNWCHTRIPKRKCKHPRRCHKTVVIVTHRKN
ncbi:protein new-glue 1-like [Drosophila mauritiana]|uniref:Protein new-glue 1-like n=1 Tax=Drosophila mauritiana TaxID=7226 RepID=A0A6P8K8T1_DROMA|nr:protein new-glue 1-like [Drosophila mauritiana]